MGSGSPIYGGVMACPKSTDRQESIGSDQSQASKSQVSMVGVVGVTVVACGMISVVVVL